MYILKHLNGSYTEQTVPKRIMNLENFPFSQAHVDSVRNIHE